MNATFSRDTANVEAARRLAFPASVKGYTSKLVIVFGWDWNCGDLAKVALRSKILAARLMHLAATHPCFKKYRAQVCEDLKVRFDTKSPPHVLKNKHSRLLATDSLALSLTTENATKIQRNFHPSPGRQVRDLGRACDNTRMKKNRRRCET